MLYQKTFIFYTFIFSVRHFYKMDKTVRLTLQFHNSPDDCCFFLSFALSVQTSTKADASKQQASTQVSPTVTALCCANHCNMKKIIGSHFKKCVIVKKIYRKNSRRHSQNKDFPKKDKEQKDVEDKLVRRQGGTLFFSQIKQRRQPSMLMRSITLPKSFNNSFSCRSSDIHNE